MKKIGKKVISIILTVVCLLGTFSGTSVYAAQETTLTDEQRNAIAMLNYITVLTQDINASKNSRVYMEEAYSNLINNTYPNAVDSRTLSQMTGLLDTMESYRMIDVKRERLQYVYEQSQAQALRSAVPNPLGLMSAVHSFSLASLIASGIYMAVDSATSYKAYTNAAEQQYLRDGWALDDEEAETLHESRKGTFSYMVKMVNDYDLPGDLTLTEDTVDEFVDWKNNKNVVGRIRFLESNKDTYREYGGYWLILADSYYEDKDYDECLDAVDTYEKMDIRIFRNDYDLAQVLPHAIVAAKEVYSSSKYASYASEKAQEIIDNTEHNDWALRYFAAQTLVDVYDVTKDKDYLQSAYDITLDNVNYLVQEQQNMNNAYLQPVQEKSIPKGSTKAQKQEIEDYNDMLNESRKTELPPVYEPLELNCDLLFALADQAGINSSDEKKIDSMLHPSGERLFLTEGLDDQYWFDNVNPEYAQENVDIVFDGTEITLPASLLSNDSNVTVTDTGKDKKTTELSDWKIDKVERGEDGDITTFKAVYTSKTAKKNEWKPDSSINVDVNPVQNNDLSYTFKYQTEGTKNHWYDYLKVWEGHKNHWYDYAKVWENSVRFVRVE